MRNKYQSFLLKNTDWPLATSEIKDRESFRREFFKYINMLEQDQVLGPNAVNMNDLSKPLGFGKATISYNYWIEPNKDGNWIKQEKSFIVKSNSGDLTEFELRFQIHQESHHILKDQDHHYLEYLELFGEDDNGPIYKMVLGS